MSAQPEGLYTDPLGTADSAAAQIAKRTGIASHDLALVMGSGWVSAADALGAPTHEFNADEIIGFLPPSVAGHSGKIRSYEIKNATGVIRVLVFFGRTHLDEGKGIEPVVHGVSTTVEKGCQKRFLNNP